MRLVELASLFRTARLKGVENRVVSGVQADSRNVKPGDLFICVPGLTFDGHDYAADAVRKGAAALVTERDVLLDVPQLIVRDARYAMAVIADCFYGFPSHRLNLIGVTGTNGKTTTANLIDRVLHGAGYRVGLMGNLGIKIDGEWRETDRNSPGNTQESYVLQRTYREMLDLGTDYCVMEVSSEGLHRGRAIGSDFRAAVFTNLTQDHLNYHITMEKYREAKGLLFSRLGNRFETVASDRKYAVLNADDEASAYFRAVTSAETIDYGIENEANVRASCLHYSPQGMKFAVEAFAESTEINLNMVGKFNVYNALAAISVGLAEGITLETIKQALESVKGVPGRVELIDEGQPFTVLVDYAHTPDGLDNVLSTIREFAAKNIITVFGCGGDRDRTKRPIMGQIAAKYSEHVIVTSDNPRSERPEAILDDIEAGLVAVNVGIGRYQLIADRRLAINKAVEMAGPGDVVLIAGKGHETYQSIGGVNHFFDDRIEARKAIRSRSN